MDRVCHGRKNMAAGTGRWWQDQEVGWSHCVYTQEAETTQKALRPTLSDPLPLTRFYLLKVLQSSHTVSSTRDLLLGTWACEGHFTVKSQHWLTAPFQVPCQGYFSSCISHPSALQEFNFIGRRGTGKSAWIVRSTQNHYLASDT